MLQLSVACIQHPVYIRVHIFVGYLIVCARPCILLVDAGDIEALAVLLFLLRDHLCIFVRAYQLHIHTVHSVGGSFFNKAGFHPLLPGVVWQLLIRLAKLVMDSAITYEYIQPAGCAYPVLYISSRVTVLVGYLAFVLNEGKRRRVHLCITGQGYIT